MYGKIGFDREFGRGLEAYNRKVGEWWFHQASNRCHSSAYQRIAKFIGDSFPRPQDVVVDYACGSGNLLARLRVLFPFSRLLGIDGSALLLGLARRRQPLSKVDFIEIALPAFSLPRAVADLVVYTFPNMVSSSADDLERMARLLIPADLAVARHLAADKDFESMREQGDPGSVYAALLRERLISLNIRELLKRNGSCVRVEYGNVPRGQLSRLEQLRIGFEEGSLDQRVRDSEPAQWFRVVASQYSRSRVIEDVEHQSRGGRKRSGGYFISVLRAL